MNRSYIKFSSVTYAQMARDVLMRNHIKSKIGRNTSPNRKKGCNYVLYVDGDIYYAYNILNRENVKNMGLEKGALT